MRHKGMVIIAGLCLACGTVAHAREQAAVAVAPALHDGGPVEGATLGTWTGRWWQWALGQWVEPYRDPDGRLCDVGQQGPVWFLAGTDGSFHVQRTCAIPLDTHVLVPVINMIYMNPRSGQARSCAELQADAAVNNDHLVSAVVLLDGQPLGDVKRHRVRSDGCFPLDPGDPSSPLAAADGYWLMLKPLPRGRHVLTVGANYGDTGTGYGGMQQNFEYVLDVGGSTLLSVAGRRIWGMPHL